jgi:hypothetical protein
VLLVSEIESYEKGHEEQQRARTVRYDRHRSNRRFNRDS